MPHHGRRAVRRVPKACRPMPPAGHRMLVPVAIMMPGVAMMLVTAAAGMLAAALVHVPEALVRPWGMVHSRTMNTEAASPVTPAARYGVAANSEAGTADNHDPDERSGKHGVSPGVTSAGRDILAERGRCSSPLDDTVNVGGPRLEGIGLCRAKGRAGSADRPWPCGPWPGGSCTRRNGRSTPPARRWRGRRGCRPPCGRGCRRHRRRSPAP